MGFMTLKPGTPKKATFGQKLAGGVERGLETGQRLMQEYQQAESYKKLGIPEGTPPELAKAYVADMLKGQQKDKLSPLQQSQKDLADERLKALQQQQGLFQGLYQGQDQGNASQDQMEGDESVSMPQQGGFDISKTPDNKLRQVAAFKGQPGEAGTIGNMAQAELDKREKTEKEKLKKFESERSFHTGYSKDAVKRADLLRESLPKKEMALNLARNAVETGDVSFFSPDKLADVTGVDLFRTAKGAQLITAGKENLLSNMSRVSARAQNIWFEQRLNSMFPKIGQDQEANLTTQEMLEAEEAMDKAYLDEFDRLQVEDDKNYGYERKDIEKRARQAIKPLENHIMQRASYRMKEIEENEKGLTSLKTDVGKNVVKGTPLTLAMARLYVDKYGKENALKVAEKNGYYIPTPDEFSSYQKVPQEFREEF